MLKLMNFEKKQEQLNLYEGRPSMYAQDSRSRPPAVVDDTTTRIYFSSSGSTSGGGGFLSYVFSMCYNLVTSILQLVFAIFRTNVRPGMNFYKLRIFYTSIKLIFHFFFNQNSNEKKKII